MKNSVYILLFITTIFCSGCIASFPTGRDAQESGQLCHYVIDNYPFKTYSVSSPNNIRPVFCRPAPEGDPHTLIVYDITNENEQNKIIELVRKYINDNKIRPIVIKFFEKENWIGDKRGGYRGPEKLIRKIKVK